MASFLLQLLIRAARERGVESLSADVLADNRAIIKVFEKSGLPVQSFMEFGRYRLTIPVIGHHLPD